MNALEKKFERELEFVKHRAEVQKLGWTFLGDMVYEQAWRGIAQIWCKEGKFALLNIMPSTGECKFIKSIEHSEAIVGLILYATPFQRQKETMDKVRQATRCYNCGKELKKKEQSFFYLESGSNVYVYCSPICKAEHKEHITKRR